MSCQYDSAALAYVFTWCFYTSPCVFYLLGLSTPCGLCGDSGTSRTSPRGCYPLCHLSFPCCRLSMSDKLPGLLRCHGWHTGWLVCMSVYACVTRSAVARGRSLERQQGSPAATCCVGPLRFALSHVIIATRGWGKLKRGNKAATKKQ